MKKTNFCTLFTALLLIVTVSLKAQSGVFDPNDADVVFTSSFQPAAPRYGPVAKWGHTNRLTWNKTKTPFEYGFKSYYYKGMSFRLKFPKSYQHNVADGRKYPVFMFFHGLAENGNIWDNEYQLRYFAQYHADKVNDGTFDGFVLFPQNQTGYFPAYFGKLAELVDSLAKYVKADEDRVIVSGVSAGGQGAWEIIGADPETYAASIPFSAGRTPYKDNFSKHLTVPIWVSNGGLDGNPTPAAVADLVATYTNMGGNIRQNFYPEGGHFVHDEFFRRETTYFPSLNTYHKANPLVYFGRTEFCPDDTVRVRMGLHPGFAAYEWQKDGIVIPGATSSEYTATNYGTYRARFKRTGTSQWSDWSLKPVVVSIKGATVPPPIQINGLRSNVLPALDGSTTVPLFEPSTYLSYDWRRVSDNALVGDANIYNAPPGEYRVRVTEKFGCNSIYSESFKVINADGANKPDKASNITAYATSNSAIRLDWNDNPNPVFNETGFEIYRSTNRGGPYTLVAITEADVLFYINTGLQANTTYYYVVRAINNDGASGATKEVSAKTSTDTTPPTAPVSLRVTSTTRSSIDLTWSPSSDDVGVAKYDIYIDGVKSYSTSETQFTIHNLTKGQSYVFTVKARDFVGNVSPASNQVTASAILSGLYYSYYQGTWTVLPNFKALTPVHSGNTPNIDISLRSQNDNFGFLWEGLINIPVSGTYYFRTTSDDGSKLWLGPLNGTASPYNVNAYEIVKNDSVHAAQDRTSIALNLTAGTYPIAAAFFQRSASSQMTLSWSTPQTASTFVIIPNKAFSDSTAEVVVPTRPDNLSATPNGYNRITLNWADKSNNESGFEVWRSTDANAGFVTIGTTGRNITFFTDSTVNSNTTYYYRIRSVGPTGESEFFPKHDLQAMWGFNGNYNDSSTYNRIITPSGSPTFSTDRKVGSHAIDLNGTSTTLTIPTTSGDYLTGGFTTKTVSAWIKSRITNSSRGIFDIGGSDNGMAMRINAGQLVAGVASGNTRRSLTVPFTSLAWNHVALVYHTNTLRLYLNGVEVANNLALPFTSIGSTTDGSMIGHSNGSSRNALAGTFNIWNGLIDHFTIVNDELSAAEINSLMNGQMVFNVYAKTAPLPEAPLKPISLVSTGKTSTSVNLTWEDKSNNETGFEVWRSVNSNTSYRFLTTLPVNTTSFQDTGIFSNVTYYYKVLAKGIGGSSDFSNEVNVTTDNNLPVIGTVTSFTMRYGGQKTVNIAASDADGEELTFTTTGLPAFGTFTNTGSGTGQFAFAPSVADSGSYDITVIVNDQHSGADTLMFTLVVNNNHVPVITPVADVEMNENTKTEIALAATDEDGNETIEWQSTGIPSFVTIVQGTNGAATMKIAPNFAQAGTYPVTLTVKDTAGAVGTYSFSLVVTNVETDNTKWYVNIQYNQLPGGSFPWNNVNSRVKENLIDHNNKTTTTGFEFMTNAWNAYNGGPITGNNSGVYPDNVIRDYYYFGIFNAPATVNFKVKNLDTTYRYNLTILGSSSWTGVADNGTTVYTIGGESKSLYVQGNTKNTVTFNTVAPNSAGEIIVNMSKGPNTPAGYLNAVVIEKIFDDGTAPVLPTDLAAEAIENAGVKLTWKDIAYNEIRYEVYRSTSVDGLYTLLNPNENNSNATLYTDRTANGMITYYYKILAVNSNGVSGFTNPVAITTSNKAPVVTPINNIYLKNGKTGTIDIASADDSGETLTVTITDLPVFATYLNTGNGTGVITVKPTINDLGGYRDITVTVTDNYGSVSEQKFAIFVGDSLSRSLYVNVAGQFGKPQGKIWNDFIAYPFAGVGMNNLRDDEDNPTTINFKLVDGWASSWQGGMITGDNTGIYPDNVILTSIYEGSTNTKRMQFTGLDPNKRYNIAVFSSNNAGFSTAFTVTAGGQSKTFDGKFNSVKTVQLNGLVSDASGIIEFSMTKSNEGRFMFLNAVVLQEYSDPSVLLHPTDLITQINTPGQINLSWSNRSAEDSLTGFEVWRAPSGGTYTMLAKTPANVSTFTDSTAGPNSFYYYRVRATGKNGQNSRYSNSAYSFISKTTALLNFNLHLPVAEPWNNTNNTPLAGAALPVIKNSDGKVTGYSFVITNDWGGQYDQGMTNGILPGNVMKTSWYIDGNTKPATMKLYNMDQSKRYRIGFMGSASWDGNFTATYTVGSKTVYLNSQSNDSKIVYIDNVVPTIDGEIDITMGYLAATRWSFLSAIILEAYDAVNIPATTGALIKAVAGSDRVIHLPVTTTQLDGTGSYADGAIASYKWTRVEGDASAIIDNNSIAKPTISNLANGRYAFELRVADGEGNSNRDTITIIVNQPPVARAGRDTVLTMPVNSVLLSGSTSTDMDGTVTSYLWQKVDGPSEFTISNPTAPNPTLVNLVVGVYKFELSVTDNHGAVSKDTVTISVVRAPNKAPVANAGGSTSITLPASVVSVNGNASSDSDGTITAYRWSQVSGPATVSFDNANTASTQARGFTTQGLYKLLLRVTDDSSATAQDTLFVTVNPAIVYITRSMRVNVFGGVNPYNQAGWNNWNATGTTNITSGNFTYSDGASSAVSAVLTMSQGISDNGASYGGTMCPPEVLRYTSFSSSNRTLTIRGLNNNLWYDIELYASRASTGNTTNFTINGVVKSVVTDHNKSNKVEFTDLVPTNGQIVISLSRTGSFNYLNGFILTEKSLAPSARNAGGQQQGSQDSNTNPQSGSGVSGEVRAYPNPFVESINVHLVMSKTEDVTLRLMDMNGRLLLTKPLGRIEGEMNVNIPANNLKSLSPGMYLLQVVRDNRPDQVIKLVKR